MADEPKPTTLAEKFQSEGVVAHQRGDIVTAFDRYCRALRQDPDQVGALGNVALILGDQRRFPAALAVARRAAAAGGSAALMNLGQLLYRCQEYAEARDAIKRGHAIDPDNWGFHQNRALIEQADGNFVEAEAWFRSALLLNPTSNECASDLAFCLFSQGKYAQAFEQNECRWAKLAKTDVWSLTPAAEWRGEPVDGKTVLVHAEQGFGDTIQFCRFVRRLRERGASTILAVPTALTRLLNASDLADSIIPIEANALPPHDFHSPMLSTMRWLGVEVGDLPGFAPYLSPPASDVPPLPMRHPSTKLAIGVCWAGGPGHEADYQRSMPIEHLMPLAEIPGVQLYSFQVGSRAADIGAAGAQPLMIDLSRLIRDFADTAALMSACDLVVSVDSAPLHIAGAVGVRTFAILQYNRCWRWLDGGPVTPWYPLMSLVRQRTPGDWAGCVERVREAVLSRLQSVVDEPAAQKGEQAA